MCGIAGWVSYDGDVEAQQAIYVDLPMIESALKLDSSAAYIFQIVAEQAERDIGLHGGPAFFDLLLIHQDFSRENQRLRAFARRHQAAFHQQFVEAQFHRAMPDLACE